MDNVLTATDSDFSASQIEGVKEPVLLKAENIAIDYERLENEIIPLGNAQIEVVMAYVPLNQLRLDPNNPRLQFTLEALGKLGAADQELLRNTLWDMPDVKDLKRAIEHTGGLIEAIIISGKDGTVFEGNCRATSFWKLNAEADGTDPRWGHIRARILPPEVTREQINILLGELHIAGKNKWSAFEQAAHLYRMTDTGQKEEFLAQTYRQSKGYVSAKIRAYKLMKETYVAAVRKKGEKVDDIAKKWSWFEEFYKKCRPSQPGKEDTQRIYDGRALEQKFCEWVADGKLPQAADVRKLYECLTDKRAMEILDAPDGDVDEAFASVTARNPILSSALWKHVSTAAQMLHEIPLPEIDALREGDPGKAAIFDSLVAAVDRIKKEARKQ